MAYTYPEIRDFAGLYLQANSFDVPDGAMEDIRNAELVNDGILQTQKGWYTSYRGLPSFTVGKIYTYVNSLMLFTADGVYKANTSVVDDLYSPEITSLDNLGGPTFGNSTRLAEQNGNLYAVSLSEPWRVDSTSLDGTYAGVEPGLDLLVSLLSEATGPLPSNSQTAYRYVFGTIDRYQNLLLGAPSDIATVGLGEEETGVSYGHVGSGPYTVTVTITVDQPFVVGDQVVIFGASDADANGTQTITAVTDTTFSYVTSSNPGSGTLSYSFTRTAVLEITLPSSLMDQQREWFYQVYRTTSSAGVDVSPSADFALIAQVNLSVADIENGFVFFTDDVDPIFAGAQLYTNPNTREGELQANRKPPLANDIQNYKNYMVYANVRNRARLAVQLIRVPAAAETVTFRQEFGSQEVFEAVSSGVGNRTVDSTSVTGTGTITITFNGHGGSINWIVSIEESDGTLPLGWYTVIASGANDFAIFSAGNTATAVKFSFIQNATNRVFYADSSSTSLATQIATTSYYLCKSVNRTSEYFYGNVVSNFDSAPGQIIFETRSVPSSTASGQIRLANSSVSPTSLFSPPAPTSFASGVQLAFDVKNLNDSIMIAKIGEPEAVPLLNMLQIGARGKDILRILVLRDSLMILKEDGVYRMTGDTIDQFNVTAIDTTVFCTSANSVDKINNSIMSLTNQGFCAISETSVQIISRRIDDIVQPINDSTEGAALCVGFGYEVGRTFLWYLPSGITLIYNVLNQKWWYSDTIANKGYGLGPDNVLYGIVDPSGEQSSIIRQRNSNTNVDYTNEFQEAIVTMSSDGISATVDITSSNPFVIKSGDVIRYGDFSDGTLNIVDTVELVAGLYNVTFATKASIPVSTTNTLIVYEAIEVYVKFAPFHAGQVGRDKQFAQFQLHLRQNAVSKLGVSFATESFGNSESVDWDYYEFQPEQPGWGFSPWGIFPWGSVAYSYVSRPTGTKQAPIIRTLVPLYANRSTFIQPILQHRQGGQALLIQALSYAVRGYSERVTR